MTVHESIDDAFRAMSGYISQLEKDLAACRDERDREIERHEHCVYWYGCRIAVLSDWFRAEAKDLPIARQYWNIIANGARDMYAPETYAQQLNRMTHRAEKAEQEREEMRGALLAARETLASVSAVNHQDHLQMLSALNIADHALKEKP